MEDHFTPPKVERERIREWISEHRESIDDGPSYPRGLTSYAKNVEVDRSTLSRALKGRPVRRRTWQKIASEYYAWTRPEELERSPAKMRGDVPS